MSSERCSDSTASSTAITPGPSQSYITGSGTFEGPGTMAEEQNVDPGSPFQNAGKLPEFLEGPFHLTHAIIIQYISLSYCTCCCVRFS